MGSSQIKHIKFKKFKTTRYKANADFNVTNNIKNRVGVAVLRDKLLKQLDNGVYEPKKLKREKVKEVLLSFRRNLIDKSGSESKNSAVSIFDYF